MTNQDLVEHLKLHGLLISDSIRQAFEKIDRVKFVPEDVRHLAYEDRALPIGYSQTISQPAVVATMLELLEPSPGQKILEIGFGSGYLTTLLASAIKETGEIFAFEAIPELAETGQRNIEKYNFVSRGVVTTITGDGSAGLPAEAPFDRIIASASADEIPEELIAELKNDGILVIPARDSLVKITKDREGKVKSTELPGYVFVPLMRTK